MKILIWILLAITAMEAAAMEKEEEKNLDPIYFTALDGNVKAAMERLHSIAPATLSAKELDTRKKYLDRFGKKEAPAHPKGNSLAEELISIYRSYWDQVLLQKLDQEEGYRYLFSQLTPVINRLGGQADSFSEKEYDRVASFLESRLKDEGYFALIGNVSPHLNLMVWRKERKKPFRVDLGDGTVEAVNVVLMDDFASLGWAAYATFDKYHVGGWVGESAIHCVASSYDLESETFRVSFLAHEARHFADKKNYPKLKSLDLEYRAKLNELLLANESQQKLLRKFMLEGKENPSNPHSYASFLMLQQFSKYGKEPLSLENLPFISKEWVHQLAKRLLSDHTKELSRHNPKKVESVLGPNGRAHDDKSAN